MTRGQVRATPDLASRGWTPGTVYAPPEHADGAVHRTKEEADQAEESGEDNPPS